MRPIPLETIDILGFGRAVFGSNFPVDGLYSDFATLWGAYREITTAFTLKAQRQLFHYNAQCIYRLM